MVCFPRLMANALELRNQANPVRSARLGEPLCPLPGNRSIPPPQFRMRPERERVIHFHDQEIDAHPSQFRKLTAKFLQILVRRMVDDVQTTPAIRDGLLLGHGGHLPTGFECGRDQAHRHRQPKYSVQ